MNELHIITPVSRPSNLPAIYHDLNSHLVSSDKRLQINWWPVFDSNCGEQAHHWKVRLSRSHNDALSINPIISSHYDSLKGHVHRNTVLDILEENAETIDIGHQWIYMLDDDNILHPSYLQTITNNENEIFDVLVVNQEQLNGKTRFYANLESINQGMADLGMLTFKLKALKGCRFNLSNSNPAIQFVKSLCNSNKGSIKLIKENRSYYNFLR